MSESVQEIAKEMINTTVDACAKQALLHLMQPETHESTNDYLRGWNDACREIARRIRELEYVG
jgi:hypothetical protein